ncbi:hypothetical protein [Leifsonia sp. PS1209]|uniref:hypothetical protein n=1 Tax=Leifsonia sp. PS1209 TaxID=2724914 RepID=UPI001442D215|nr:hypothetical protein [Leifsonia sp. PS1209]QIZ99228.1 hypothetical protein HF024_12365 [Leifsonia sp. PS1209]
MSTETFMTTVLPRSTRPDADAHVSVFVSPKLVPDAATARLDTFALFPHWAAQVLDGLTIELADDAGAIDCTVATTAALAPDAGVWDTIFPPDTPVRGNPVPRLDQNRWRGFSARSVHDIGKLVHLATVLSDPTSPPAPSAHPLAQQALGMAQRWPVHGGDDRRRPEFDEARLTAFLDESIETDAEPQEISRRIAANEDWFLRALGELHRARRYYERPESAQPYQEMPDTQPVGLPRQGPEFHERVGTIGDHPALLRKTGLVIDLRVTDPARLLSSRWLSAVLTVSGYAAACRPTHVFVRALGDGTFVTVAQTGDWIDGSLAIGDDSLFSVLDLDADGTALKTERFLWTLPRLLHVQDNDDPVNAATPAMRASGLTVSRAEEAQSAKDQLAHQAALETTAVPDLFTEQVTRGMRVEVWDDTVRTWSSLHARLADIDARHDDGTYTPVFTALPEQGFIQGTAANQTPGDPANPVNVHEAVFGWEGWSLSAPRPGKRVRNEQQVVDGREQTVEVVEDVPDDVPDPTHPLRFANRVAPGTLPRLRFGRSYAFRAWQVDLAGNTRADELNPQPLPPGPPPEVLLAGLQTVPPPLFDAPGATIGPVLSGLRDGTAALHEARLAVEDAALTTEETIQADDRQPDAAETLRGAFAAAPTGAAPSAVIDGLLARVRATAQAGPAAARQTAGAAAAFGRAADRRSLVDAAFAAAVVDPAIPFAEPTITRDPSRLAAIAAAQLTGQPEFQGGAGAALDPAVVAAALRAAMKKVTPLVPFLRWDPVPSPALVPRRRFTEGESLRVLVVRSGVTQDPETLAITVTEPAAYAASVDAAHGYGADTERHLAAPKTSQIQAEQHGEFDAAIGDGQTAAQRAAAQREALAAILRENGSFFDVDVADLSTVGARIQQPGMALLSQTLEADGSQPVPSPANGLRMLALRPGELPDPDPAVERLRLRPGDAPAPGQYVVHDVDELELPYLPDPLADGVSLVFPEAGAGRTIRFPFGTEGFTAAYRGDWPDRQPFLLSLEGGDVLDSAVASGRIRFVLPPGDVQRARLASSLVRSRLDWLGVWRSFAAVLQQTPEVREAAVDGWLWGLSPFEDLTFVHAVPRPLVAPRPTVLHAFRLPGDTSAFLFGGVDVDGQSTDSITAQASWDEPVDDIAQDAPSTSHTDAIAFTTAIVADEQVAVLAGHDAVVTLPGYGPLRTHESTHRFADTKHRRVSYFFRAATRFREYFAPELLRGDPANPLDDGASVIGETVEVSVPSSARPAAPLIHSVLPLFRWNEGVEPEQPMARRVTRQAGVRIYLQRPWYSSGEGELLAVLLAANGNDAFGEPADDPGTGFPYVSQWGGDPIWLSAPVAARPLKTLQLDDLLHASGIDDEPRPGRPVTPAVSLPLPAGVTDRNVLAVGYRPQYSAERKLWFVDIAIDPGTAFWPFVRLAVARYQPDSVAGEHLSSPVRCDFVQLTPERIASVSRTDDTHVRVVVSGTRGITRDTTAPRFGLEGAFARPADENRLLVASIQTVDPSIGGDLGWRTVATGELVLRGTGANAFEGAWVGELDAGVVIPLSRPGHNPGWRVHVEEWERFPGDPPAPEDTRVYPDGRVWEQRLVFAADVEL